MRLPEHVFTPSTREQWHRWLEDHHSKEREVWLVHFKKGARRHGLTYEEAVEEALCFGWIDGLLRSFDEDRFLLRYTPRKANSIWSENNKRRVEKLIGEGRMTEAGLAKIQEAKRNGQWQAAAEREEVQAIPADLYNALRRRKGALSRFRVLSPSQRKMLHYWVQNAKRHSTRQARIEKILSDIMGSARD